MVRSVTALRRAVHRRIRPSTQLGGLGGSTWTSFLETKLSGLLLLLTVAFLWEIAIRVGIVDLPSFPAVTVIIARWFGLVADGTLLIETGRTMWRLGAGFVLACLIGLPLGLAMGVSKKAYGLLEPGTELLRPIPASALVPVFILFLGIQNSMKIALILYATVFPILLNTFSGVRGVDSVLIETARTLGLPRRAILWRVRLPAALPFIFTGMRISLGVALVLAVVAEMVGGGRGGIGWFILNSQRSFQVSAVYAGIITIGLVGYLLNRLFLYAEAKVLFWHEQDVTI